MKLRLPRLTMVRLRSPQAVRLAMTGDQAWRKHGFAPTATISLFAFILFFTPFAHAVNVDVADISNRQYYNTVLTEITNAKSEIFVAMYAMYVRPSEPDSIPNKLINALIDAQKRGVMVIVYLDYTKGNGKYNVAAYDMLQRAGVSVYFIDPKIKLHAKTIVIDNNTVIDGSANWTQAAALENFESNNIFRGKEFAEEKLKFFKELEKRIIAAPDKKPIPTVKISGKFLTDSRFCPALVVDNSGNALKLYLKLLQNNKPGWVDIDYALMGRYLWPGFDRQPATYRFRIRDIVNKLKSSYHLLDYRLTKKNNLAVRLADYEDESKDYASPKENYFSLPITFWESGLACKLNDAETMAYLICLYEQARQWPRNYWSLGIDAMVERYHISRTTLLLGFGALEKMDLIDVWRTRSKPGDDFADRDVNQYKLKPIFSDKERAVLWQKMEKKCGKAKVKLAREFAQVIDKENNFDAVNDIIAFIDEYGEPLVRKAIGYMANLAHNNSVRDTVYLRGILRNLAAEADNNARLVPRDDYFV